MNKFKLGDTVKLKSNSRYEYQSKGDNGVIMSVRDGSYPYTILWKYQSCVTWCYPEEDVIKDDFIPKYVKRHCMV